jgi:hypothetical protein
LSFHVSEGVRGAAAQDTGIAVAELDCRVVTKTSAVTA